ncbi:hypothetical protein BSG1_12771 [Bacillus sp. SG-1]|nr:hypothetical protein BSG1_12771 [Bacillus sp. SG-1]
MVIQKNFEHLVGKLLFLLSFFGLSIVAFLLKSNQSISELILFYISIPALILSMVISVIIKLKQ